MYVQRNNYYHDPGTGLGFLKKIGRAFKRMVKITPKSFRPANIFRAATSTALTAVTGGALPLLAPKLHKQGVEIGAKIMPGLIAAATIPMAAGLINSVKGTPPAEEMAAAGVDPASAGAGYVEQATQAINAAKPFYQTAMQTVKPAPVWTQENQPALMPYGDPPHAMPKEIKEAGFLEGQGMVIFLGVSAVGALIHVLSQRKGR